MCDKLSSLPDSLLLHILSFLPTKQAVATSFLSKRWRPLRHSLPTLIIHDAKFLGREVFIQFVDDVLISGDLKFLKNFGLNCWSLDLPNDKINIWIDALINSKVEHLEIWFPYRFNTKLPSGVFNCSTIRVLKFHGITFSSLSSVNLPSLEVLHLNRVRLPDINCLAMLLSGCALLEMLVLTDLDVNNYGPTQEIGKLNHLVTAVVPPSLVPLEALSNVTFLSLQSIWSPGVTMHAIWSPDADNIPTFYNLTHLECYVDGWTRIVNCFRNFPKLQNLVIFKLFCRFPHEPIPNVPTCLSSHLKEFTFGDFQLHEAYVAFMKFILNNAQVLCSVKITSGYTLSSEVEISEMIKVISGYPRASENCKFLHDISLGSSRKDWDCWFRF
ncbi:hypothetical protein QN277_024664 [Acacia crassicarpa]|uniref:F-box domain-containing protein n=1 Tax=Acacia crassicarpa TaxID=499986 RepID=A0AAE1JFA7_9FABA|nr:hypothetical protein QN277_024664 [Acacia crassicarpa]